MLFIRNLIRRKSLTMDLKVIGENKIHNAETGKISTMSELWQNDTCVVIFLRRWGCAFCRLWAKEVSEIEPILKKHNVRLVGVGCEELGVEEFKNGNYFKGELYYTVEKSTYNMLGFKRFSYISVMAALLWKESREAIAKSKKLNVGGNIKGDGLQNGGALIVGKGGEILTHFIQNGPAEHLSNTAILKALKLDDEIANLPKEEADVVTSEGECQKT